MDVSATSNTPASATRTQTPETPAPASEAPATDFQTFLTLLTTQLRNQDPLKPIESTEFVAQLASFSGVEQQVRTNDRLDQIYGALGGGASAGLAAWIGREVRAPTQAAYSGVPVAIETTPLADADSAVLVVTNDFGQVVARRAVDPADATLTWDGADALGASLPHGLYAFTIESLRDGETIGAEKGQVFATVSEVRIEDGEATLILDGGAKVAVDDVSALR
jgi:flagellar basal-body rod modification protein FlgD